MSKRLITLLFLFLAVSMVLASHDKNENDDCEDGEDDRCPVDCMCDLDKSPERWNSARTKKMGKCHKKPPGNTGDPIFTGFDGSMFEFQGKPNSVFNVLSEQNHQVNALFTPAKMYNHNGAYISAFGLKVYEHQILVQVDSETAALSVTVDGAPLAMPKSHGMVKTLDAADPAKNVSVVLEQFRPGVGWAFDVQTPMLFFAISSVATTVDEGGVPQPAYLNSRTDLLAPPASEMQGVIGRTFNNLLTGTSTSQAVAKAEDLTEQLLKFQVSGLLADDFEANRFNVQRGRTMLAVDVPAAGHFALTA